MGARRHGTSIWAGTVSGKVMWSVIKWPGWIVVGVAIGGAVKATALTDDVHTLQAKVRDLPEIGRQLDSLRIEQRHMSATLDEVRALLGRRTAIDMRRPIP